MKVLIPLLLALSFATPAGALEAIGEIRANLDGEELNWKVLRQDDGSAMVQITDIGPLTMIELHALGDGSISIGLIFHGKPSGDTPPAGLTIEIRPDRGALAGAVWESEDESPQMSIDLLDLEDDRSHTARDDRSTSKVVLVFRDTRPATRVTLSRWSVSGDGPALVANDINAWLRRHFGDEATAPGRHLSD